MFKSAFTLIVLGLLCGVYANAPRPLIPQKGGISKLMPEKWDTLKAYPRASDERLLAEPSGYFVQYLYTSATCASAEQAMVAATGTDVCFTGFTNGTAVGSIFYTLGGTSADSFTIKYSIYENVFDCTDSVSGQGEETYPTSCQELSDSDLPSLSFGYTSDPTVWTSYEPGYMWQ